MDSEPVDYSLDPFSEQSIFCCPNPKPALASFVASSCSNPMSVVSLPRLSASTVHIATLSIYSLALDYPPLSPRTLNLLVVYSSPSFDPLPPVDHLFPANPSSSPGLEITAVPENQAFGHDTPSSSAAAHTSAPPSGCFETPVIRVRTTAQKTQQETPSPLDPLQDHPIASRSGKRKAKCVKASRKDFTIKFGECLTMGVVVDMTGKVLVGKVRGRTYSAERLGLWVK